MLTCVLAVFIGRDGKDASFACFVQEVFVAVKVLLLQGQDVEGVVEVALMV